MKTILKLMTVSILISSCQERYKEYVPVYPKGDREGGGFVEQRDSLTPKHLQGIKKVFTFYMVNFQTDGERVFYKGLIEQDLLWNYSRKATDAAWLQAHR